MARKNNSATAPTTSPATKGGKGGKGKVAQPITLPATQYAVYVACQTGPLPRKALAVKAGVCPRTVRAALVALMAGGAVQATPQGYVAVKGANVANGGGNQPHAARTLLRISNPKQWATTVVPRTNGAAAPAKAKAKAKAAPAPQPATA